MRNQKSTTALNNELSREKSAATVGAHEPALGIPRIHRNSAFYTASAGWRPANSKVNSQEVGTLHRLAPTGSTIWVNHLAVLQKVPAN